MQREIRSTKNTRSICQSVLGMLLVFMWLSVWSVFPPRNRAYPTIGSFIYNDIYCKLYPLELIPRLAMASPNREGSEGSIANFQLYFDEIKTPCFAIQLVGSTIQIHWLLTSWRFPNRLLRLIESEVCTVCDIPFPSISIHFIHFPYCWYTSIP